MKAKNELKDVKRREKNEKTSAYMTVSALVHVRVAYVPACADNARFLVAYRRHIQKCDCSSVESIEHFATNFEEHIFFKYMKIKIYKYL